MPGALNSALRAFVAGRKKCVRYGEKEKRKDEEVVLKEIQNEHS
jgi:hypothetical protein